MCVCVRAAEVSRQANVNQDQATVSDQPIEAKNNYKQQQLKEHADLQVPEEKPVHREGHRLLLQILTVPSLH